MEINFDADFFRNPEVKGILIGVLVGAALLFGTYYWINNIKQEQQQKIAFLQSEIKRLRPPSDTPETNWQRIMREAAREQQVFWGQRLLMLSAHMPEESWLRSVSLSSGDSKKKKRAIASGFNVAGSIYTSSTELNLGSLGDYILECLDDKDLMQGLNNWQIRSIARKDATTINFDLLSPR